MGYLHSDETTDLAVTNAPIQGKIRIVKKDQLTGDLLTGAEFTITRISGILRTMVLGMVKWSL